MLRALGIFMMAAALLAAAYGAAASLTFTPGVLQASDPPVATCDSGTLPNPSVSYTVTLSLSTGKFKVSEVTVSGFEPACNDKNIKVQLTKAGGAPAGGTGPGTILGGSGVVGIPSAPTAEEVTGIHVAVGDIQ